MEMAGSIVWIGFFVAALLLKLSARGNNLLILALVAYGLPGFVYSLLDWGMLNYSVVEELYPVLQYMSLVASILLVVGVIMLARGVTPAAGGGGRMQDAGCPGR